MGEFVEPYEVNRNLDHGYLDDLIHREHVEFSGELPAFAEPAKHITVTTAGGKPAAPAVAAESYLPPALATRIHAYEQEKAALQEALATRIKERTPGADTRQSIDAFNQENATRIAALTTEREAIRNELAKLAAANTDAAAGKSLQTLLQEFAAGVQEMAPPAGPASK
jgi:hypothetical protein